MAPYQYTETRKFDGKVYHRVHESFWTKKEAEERVKQIRNRGDHARITCSKFSTFENFPRPQKKKTGTEYTVWYRGGK
jgi:hypothetical protein